MRPPGITGGIAGEKRTEHLAEQASMRPPGITGGISRAAVVRSVLEANIDASMRPPGITGGILAPDGTLAPAGDVASMRPPGITGGILGVA